MNEVAETPQNNDSHPDEVQPIGVNAVIEDGKLQIILSNSSE